MWGIPDVHYQVGSAATVWPVRGGCRVTAGGGPGADHQGLCINTIKRVNVASVFLNGGSMEKSDLFTIPGLVPEEMRSEVEWRNGMEVDFLLWALCVICQLFGKSVNEKSV